MTTNEEIDNIYDKLPKNLRILPHMICNFLVKRGSIENKGD